MGVSTFRSFPLDLSRLRSLSLTRHSRRNASIQDGDLSTFTTEKTTLEDATLCIPLRLVRVHLDAIESRSSLSRRTETSVDPHLVRQLAFEDHVL